MTQTERDILEAAIRLFTRYGVKRSSMGDLAKEAGVSRQTLYNTFRNRDDVLRALIRSHTDDAVTEIETRIETVPDLGDQLDIAFERMTVSAFNLVAATPNAQDLVDGFNRAGQEELDAASERFRVLIARILSPHLADQPRAGLTLEDFSDFVQSSSRAIGRTARDRDHLLRQLQVLKTLSLAGVGQ